MLAQHDLMLSWHTRMLDGGYLMDRVCPRELGPIVTVRSDRSTLSVQVDLVTIRRLPRWSHHVYVLLGLLGLLDLCLLGLLRLMRLVG